MTAAWLAAREAEIAEADRLDLLREPSPAARHTWRAEFDAEKHSDARLGDQRMRNGMQFAYGSNRRFP